jgi:hypothetical protein
MIYCFVFHFDRPKIETFHAKKQVTKINYIDYKDVLLNNNHVGVESFTLCCIESNVHACFPIKLLNCQCC